MLCLSSYWLDLDKKDLKKQDSYQHSVTHVSQREIVSQLQANFLKVKDCDGRVENQVVLTAVAAI